jgi:hypothetical protein
VGSEGVEHLQVGGNLINGLAGVCGLWCTRRGFYPRDSASVAWDRGPSRRANAVVRRPSHRLSKPERGGTLILSKRHVVGHSRQPRTDDRRGRLRIRPWTPRYSGLRNLGPAVDVEEPWASLYPLR